MKRLASLIIFCLSTSTGLLAQTAADVETKAYGSYAGGKFDTVDLATGNLYINIPLVSYPQLGKLKPLSFAIGLNNAPYTQEFGECDMDSGDCHILSSRYDTSPPGSMSAQAAFFENSQPSSYHNLGAYITSSYEGAVVTGVTYEPGPIGTIVYTLVDPGGSTHPLELEAGSTNKYHATDGSGYTFTAAGQQLAYDAYNSDNDFYYGSTYWLSEYSSTSQSGFFGGVRLGDVLDSSGVKYSNTLFTSGVPSAAAYTGPSTPAVLTSTATDPFGNTITRGPWFWSNYEAGQLAGVKTFQDAHSTGPQAIGYTDSVNRFIPDILSTQATLPGMTGAPTSLCDLPTGSISIPWTVPGPNNTTVTYTLRYSYKQYFKNWTLPTNDTFVADQTGGCGYALDSVMLPNSTQWAFHYDNNLDLLKVDLPTGGHVAYTYTDKASFDTWGGNRCSAQCHVVSTRTEDDGGTWSATTTYNYGTMAKPAGSNQSYATSFYTTETDATGNDTVNVFSSIANLQAAHIFESQTDTYQGQTGVDYSVGAPTSMAANLLARTTTGYDSVADFPYPGVDDIVNVLPRTITSWTLGTIKTTTREYPNLFTAIQMHCTSPGGQANCTAVSMGQGQPPVSPVIRYVSPMTESEYAGSAPIDSAFYRKQINNFLFSSDAGVLDTNLLTLSDSTVLKDGSGNILRSTSYGYDENTDCSSRTGGPYGSLTSILDSLGSERDMFYNCQGMPTRMLDPNGNTTAITSYDGTGLFPVTVQRPTTNGVHHVDNYSYDSVTGQVTSHTDENGQTTLSPHDNMGRPTSVSLPDGGGATYCYTDTGGSCNVTSAPFSTYVSARQSSNTSVSTRTDFDGLGRPVRSSLTSDPAGAVTTDTVYDTMGRVQSSTNPHRSTPLPTDGKTLLFYDALGRKLVQCQADGSNTNTCLAGTSQSWAYTGVSNGGDVTTFGDETGSTTQSTSDTWGRLADVLELGTPALPLRLETQYGYDTLGNLTSVAQLGAPGDTPRYRSFTYDALSRLITSFNPETGMTCYGHWNNGVVGSGNCQNGYDQFGSLRDGYDANGNVLTKSDARGIETAYTYDALSRLLSKSYANDSSGSLSSCYQYDGASTTNGLGRLSAQWTQKGACPSSPGNAVPTKTIFSAYDAMGRVSLQQQCILSTCSANPNTSTPATYQYDLAGNLTSYGDGEAFAQFTNQFDAAGHLQSVTSSWADATRPATLFSAQSYSPAGLLTGALFGVNGISNSVALSDTRTYDNRERLVTKSVLGGTAQNPQTSVTLSVAPSAFTPIEDAVGLIHVSCNSACGQVQLTIDGNEWVNWPLDSSGDIRIETYYWNSPWFTVGPHTITANYAGNSTYPPGFASTNITVLPPGTQPVSVALSANPGTTFGTSDDFSFGVRLGCSADCEGLVQLAVDGNLWWMGPLGQDGSLAAGRWWNGSEPPFLPGSHTMQAFFLGNSAYGPSSSNVLPLTINADDGTQQAHVSLSMVPPVFSITEGSVGSVHVDCNSACGQVQLAIDGNGWVNWPLDSNGNISIDTYWWGSSWFTEGAHTITANYQGNQTYAPAASNSATIMVDPPGTQASSISLSATPGTTFGTSDNFGFFIQLACTGDCGGMVQITVDGNLWFLGPLGQGGGLAAGRWWNGSEPPFLPGNHTMQVNFLGNTVYAAGTSNTLNLNITQ